MEELLKKANAGDADAMYRLGRVYQMADDPSLEKPDYETAFKWFEKAAMLQHTDAMNSLADALSLGRGCKRDLAMASVWYQESYDAVKRIGRR